VVPVDSEDALGTARLPALLSAADIGSTTVFNSAVAEGLAEIDAGDADAALCDSAVVI